jgi:FlaA1/EpsC-like NDP-sugar epimerase
MSGQKYLENLFNMWYKEDLSGSSWDCFGMDNTASGNTPYYLRPGYNYLITGGAGFIGSEVVRLLSQDKDTRSIRVLDVDEHGMFQLKEKKYSKVRYLLGDIRDKERVRMALDGVDIVIHLSAYKHVYFGEYNLPEFVDTNVIGTLTIIEECLSSKSVKRFINISTDKAVYPTSSYGITKLLSEKITLWAHRVNRRDQIFSSVRFGNVLGSRGSVIPKFMKQIECKEPLTITDIGMRRFIMTLREAAEFIIDCVLLAKGGEIFIKKMPVVNIMDLGEALGMSDYTIIGMFPGEKIDEVLTTDEECERSVNYPNHIRIYDEVPDKYHRVSGHISDVIEEKYSTSTVGSILTVEEIKKLLEDDIHDNNG